MKISIVAVGKLRGAYAGLCEEYLERMNGTVTMREVAGSSVEAEGNAIMAALPDGAFVVVLDERGEDISSRELAERLAKWQEIHHRGIAFVIGGADGLAEKIRKHAGFTLGLGRKTWPHRLARVMLAEQIYRARQITAGHPYHHE